MALTKYLNYYIDDDGYYRRIPWDTWVDDGVVIGLGPVGLKRDDVISYDSDGVVTLDMDFLDIADVGTTNLKTSEIKSMEEQTDERTLLASYENVHGFYESDVSQTYEFDYDKPLYNAFEE